MDTVLAVTLLAWLQSIAVFRNFVVLERLHRDQTFIFIDLSLFMVGVDGFLCTEVNRARTEAPSAIDLRVF
ncbi:hypothetical protein DSUL_60082 [Desulfovibrionales bacterium]